MNTERKPGLYRAKYKGTWYMWEYRESRRWYQATPFPHCDWLRDEDFDEIIETPISPEPQEMTRDVAIAFLDSIRDYEAENGDRICTDERTSEELFDIFVDSEDYEVATHLSPPAVNTREVTDEEILTIIHQYPHSLLDEKKVYFESIVVAIGRDLLNKEENK